MRVYVPIGTVWAPITSLTPARVRSWSEEMAAGLSEGKTRARLFVQKALGESMRPFEARPSP